METTIVNKIELLLQSHPAITLAEFEEIVSDLIGRTRRSITDNELSSAFNRVLDEWKK